MQIQKSTYLSLQYKPWCFVNAMLKLNMKHKYYFMIAIFFIAKYDASFAQENIFTAGFQYRPIFINSFFNKDATTTLASGLDFNISQKRGYSAGMILRRGFTKQLSIETGINYTRRNFDLTITDTTFIGKSDFGIIGYEIPIQGMVFLRIAEKIYMNTSLGLSMDMYASNISTKDTYFRHFSKRNSIFQFAALANLGFEWRTEKSGYFYLGSSYHLPFSFFYSSSIMYEPSKEIGRLKLSGTFLTLDFRYYFHEEPLKPKKKKKK